MHGSRTEVGGGGRWPRFTLKITSSIGNKQLSSTLTPVEPLWNQKVQFSFEIDSWSHCKQAEDVEPTVDKLRTKTLTKLFSVMFWEAPPPPPLRRKLLDPRMSVLLFSELMKYNKGVSNMLGESRSMY